MLNVEYVFYSGLFRLLLDLCSIPDNSMLRRQVVIDEEAI
jgi:hypothetical protein